MWSTFFSSCASKDNFQNSLEDQLWPLVPIFFYTLIIDLKHAQRANINFCFNLAQISCEGSLLVTRLHSFQARRQPIEWKARLGPCSLHFFFLMIHWICLLGWDCQQRFPLNALSDVLRHLTDSIWLKGFELWCHHMLAHSTLKTQQFWEGFLPHQHNICSPTVSLSRYIFLWLCLRHKKIKINFKDHCFDILEEMHYSRENGTISYKYSCAYVYKKYVLYFCSVDALLV